MRTVTSSQGFPITIGENAGENDALRKRARQNDLWFHLEGMPSAHAVLHTSGDGNGKAKAIADSELRDSIHEVCQLLKYFSKARDMRQVTVIFVETKFVSSIQGAPAGKVNVKKNPRNRVVVADDAALQTLLPQVTRT